MVIVDTSIEQLYQIDPPIIDFGEIITNEKLQKRITLTFLHDELSKKDDLQVTIVKNKNAISIGGINYDLTKNSLFFDIFIFPDQLVTNIFDGMLIEWKDSNGRKKMIALTIKAIVRENIEINSK